MLPACAMTASPDDSSGSSADELVSNVDAHHCEIFVDKVAVVSGTFGYEGVDVYVKVLPGRLSEDLLEVGFYGKTCVKGACGGWSELPLDAHAGAKDYFVARLQTYGWRDGEQTHVGSFYARTRDGRTYWLNSHGRSQENFTFDRGTYRWFRDLSDGALTTQAEEALRYLNPDRCF